MNHPMEELIWHEVKGQDTVEFINFGGDFEVTFLHIPFTWFHTFFSCVNPSEKKFSRFFFPVC